MAKHDHHHCEHDLAYCDHCDTAYCRQCPKEWKPPCTQAHYYPWTYSGTLTNAASGSYYNTSGTLLDNLAHPHEVRSALCAHKEN